jgi:predicted nucleic acid-binding protein
VICLDASVAVKLVLPEEHSDRAAALLADAVRRRERVISTHLLPIEANNTLRQRMRREGMSLDEARRRLEALLAFPITLAPTVPAQRRAMHERALSLADRFELPAVYDAYYLALAELRRCPLWTADRQLIRAIGGGGPELRWIGDHETA